MEPFYMTLYHYPQGQLRYFSVSDELEKVINQYLEYFIDQLSRNDEDELGLRLRIEQQLKMMKKKS